MDLMPLLVAGTVGVTLIGIGLLFFAMRRADLVSLGRLAGSSAIPVSEAGSSGGIEISGTARPVEGGRLRAPLTGRDVVIYRLSALSRGGTASTYQPVYVERALPDFLVEDGSIRRARVSFVKGQTGLFLDPSVLGPDVGAIRDPTVYAGPATEEHRAWLESRMKGPVPALRDLKFEERVVEVGQDVSVLGWPGEKTTEDELVITSGGPGLDRELLLWCGGKPRLMARLGRGRLLARAFLGAGMLSIATGLVLSLI